MGYNLKHVVRGGGTEKEYSLPWAQSYAATPYFAGSMSVDKYERHESILVELTLADRSSVEVDLGEPGKTFAVRVPDPDHPGEETEEEIPVESESIYVESDSTGKTVNSLHWPPKDRQEKEFRA